MLKRLVLVLTVFLVASCATGMVPIMAAARVENKIGQPIDGCSMEVTRDGKSQYKIAFDKTITSDVSYYPSLGNEPPVLIFECAGYKDVHKYKINPENHRWSSLKEVYDLGVFTFVDVSDELKPKIGKVKEEPEIQINTAN